MKIILLICLFGSYGLADDTNDGWAIPDDTKSEAKIINNYYNTSGDSEEIDKLYKLYLLEFMKGMNNQKTQGNNGGTGCTWTSFEVRVSKDPNDKRTAPWYYCK